MKFIGFALLFSFSAMAQISPAFNLYLEDAFQKKSNLTPLQSSWWGIEGNFNQAEPFTEKFSKKEVLFLKDELKKLESNFPYNSLTKEEKTQYDVLVYKYKEEITKKSLYFYHTQIFNPWDGSFELYASILSSVTIKKKEDLKSFTALLKNSKKHINELINKSIEAEKRGITEASLSIEGALKSMYQYVEGFPIENSHKQNIIFKQFKEQIKKTSLSTKLKEKYTKRVSTLLQKVWAPSYTRLISRAKDLLTRVKTNHGVSSLPKGKEYYQFLLRSHTTTNLTAKEIHKIGLTEVTKIKKEMEKIKTQVGYSGTLKEFFHFLRTDPQFFYENSDLGRQEYLNETHRVIDEVSAIAHNYFLNPPASKVNIKVVDPSTPYRSMAYYQPNENGGTYYLDLRDMTQVPRYELQALAFHEGSPGHHFHMSYVRQIKDLPNFRLFTFFNAHGEGWGLYTERLAHEIGLYKDAFAEMGRLNFEMLRAIRLVVDTGLHAYNWSLEEALQFGLANSGMTESSLKAQMLRYLQYPGQATSYKVGMNFILEQREKAKKELGNAFDIREYHEVVLANGFLPLSLLKNYIHDWVSSK